MEIIVAADKNWAIGRGGQLLAEIPEERQLLREETAGQTVIMGRKTLDGLLGGRPLQGRKNIVLTSNPAYTVRDAVICHSVEEVLREAAPGASGRVFVIGGERVYRQLLPFCSVVHAARIDYEYDGDAYFPNLNGSPEWRMAAETEEKTYFDICYTFQMYVRVPAKP